MKTPFELPTPLWVLVIVAAVSPVVGALGMEVYERHTRQAELVERWSSACTVENEPHRCSQMLASWRDDCFRESLTHQRREAVFDPVVFFECMNERNDLGMHVEVPET